MGRREGERRGRGGVRGIVTTGEEGRGEEEWERGDGRKRNRVMEGVRWKGGEEKGGKRGREGEGERYVMMHPPQNLL